MNTKNYCPCCSNSMLHHLSNKHSYWYCPSCRIEMPHLESKQVKDYQVSLKFSQSLESAVLANKNAREAANYSLKN